MPLNLWAALSEVYEGSNGIRKKAWRDCKPAARVCVVLMDGAGRRLPRRGRRGLGSKPCQALPPSQAPSQASLVQLMRSRLRSGMGQRPEGMLCYVASFSSPSVPPTHRQRRVGWGLAGSLSPSSFTLARTVLY